MYPHRPFVTASVSSELILPSDRRGWPPCTEHTKQSEHLFALVAVHERTIGDVGICLALPAQWLITRRANSLNLMERGPTFCTAEERVAGPNARSETVGSRSNSIGQGRGPPNCGPMKLIVRHRRQPAAEQGDQLAPPHIENRPFRASIIRARRTGSPRKAIPACMAPNGDWGHIRARSHLAR